MVKLPTLHKSPASAGSAETPFRLEMPRALVLAAAYEAGGVWPLLSNALTLPVIRPVATEEKASGLQETRRERPVPHRHLEGTASALAERLQEEAEPVLLVGPWAALNVQGAALVLFAGGVGRHRWRSEMRAIRPTLELHDVRPAVIEKLIGQLFG